MKPVRCVTLVTLAAGLAGAVPLAAQRTASPHSTDPRRGLDAYVTQLMREWKVPGLAVAVVHGDSMVFAKGYGVRRLGDPTPVDPNTVFAIGSSSKAFTGAAVGMLVDEGKVTWDGPVTSYLPYFQMYDPWVTREITVRDLLTHRSGLSRGDQLWYGTSRNREEVVRGIRNLKPTWSMRTQFGYQNLMFITAGEVVHQVSGESWDDFLKSHLFGPLGMTTTNTSTNDLAALPNVASPHALLDDSVRVIPWRNIDNAGPAGSINSNVIDMSKWLRLWVNGGTFGGKRLLSEATVREATSPQFVVNDRNMILRMDSPRFLDYGFGWFLQDFRGRKWVNHGGNIDGMAALVGFLPDDKLGVVILTNLNGSDITIPLMENLFDRFLGISPPKDYNTSYLAKEQEFQAAGREARQKRVAARASGTHPTLPLERYAGTYENPLYGTATVRFENGALSVRYDAGLNTVGDLSHWDYDTFEAKMRDPMLGTIPVSFELGTDGAVARMTFAIEGPIVWNRTGARPLPMAR